MGKESCSFCYPYISTWNHDVKILGHHRNVKWRGHRTSNNANLLIIYRIDLKKKLVSKSQDNGESGETSLGDQN